MISYTFAIIDVLLGNSKTSVPFADLNIHSSNSLNNTILISNNLVEDDTNLYELSVQNHEQFKELYQLLESEQKPNGFVLKNHYTAHGQYLEFVHKNQLIQLNIKIVFTKTHLKKLVC